MERNISNDTGAKTKKRLEVLHMLRGICLMFAFQHRSSWSGVSAQQHRSFRSLDIVRAIFLPLSQRGIYLQEEIRLRAKSILICLVHIFRPFFSLSLSFYCPHPRGWAPASKIGMFAKEERMYIFAAMREWWIEGGPGVEDIDKRVNSARRRHPQILAPHLAT